MKQVFGNIQNVCIVKKDVDPHHDCQVVKQCKKEGMRYCFHRSCMRKHRENAEKNKKMLNY